MEKRDRQTLAQLLEENTNRKWKDGPGPRGSVVLHSGGWTVDRYGGAGNMLDGAATRGVSLLVVKGPLMPGVSTPCSGRGWPQRAVQVVLQALKGAVDTSMHCHVPLAVMLELGPLEHTDPPVLLYGGTVGYMPWHTCYPIIGYHTAPDDTVVLPASIPALVRLMLRSLAIPEDRAAGAFLRTSQNLENAHLLIESFDGCLVHFCTREMTNSICVPDLKNDDDITMSFAKSLLHVARAHRASQPHVASWRTTGTASVVQLADILAVEDARDLPRWRVTPGASRDSFHIQDH